MSERLVEAAQRRILQINVVRAKVNGSVMADWNKRRTLEQLDELQAGMETIVRRYGPEIDSSEN